MHIKLYTCRLEDIYIPAPRRQNSTTFLMHFFGQIFFSFFICLFLVQGIDFSHFLAYQSREGVEEANTHNCQPVLS